MCCNYEYVNCQKLPQMFIGDVAVKFILLIKN